MSDDVEIAQSVSIRDAGLDEYWLQDQIFENPTCLDLGQLESISKEKLQGSGGRLDLLLNDPEDDSMYEVEVMLGETNETHIIRTIEYWDNEKRRWPQRQHYAVLVAERITRRFFNVIQLLSNSIPIIAIQVSLLAIDGKKTLFFTKVLDPYVEADDGTSGDGRPHTREDWIRKAKWTLDAADSLMEATSNILGAPVLNYLQNYVAITVGGNNYMWLHKRTLNKSLLICRIDQSLQDNAAAILDAGNIAYVRKPKSIRIVVDKEMIEKNAELFKSLAALVKKSWEGDA